MTRASIVYVVKYDIGNIKNRIQTPVEAPLVYAGVVKWYNRYLVSSNCEFNSSPPAQIFNGVI